MRWQDASTVRSGRLVRWLTLAIALAWAALAPAADLVREGRLAMAIERSAAANQGQWLQSGDVSFYSLLAEVARQPPEGAVLILPGSQAGPDQEGLIRALRTGLPERGWITLSIQTPMASELSDRSADALLVEEALPRIRLALQMLVQRKVENIVLLGFDLGGQMALRYLSEGADEAVRGAVLISTPAYSGDSAWMPKTALPILDLLGGRDGKRFLAEAEQRSKRFNSASGGGYRQLEISGADHDFRGLEPGVVSRVAAWIKTVAPGTALPNGAKEGRNAASEGK